MALDIGGLGVVRLTGAKDIGLFPVDGIVALEEVLLAHAQGDTQDVLDKQQDQAGPDQVPADDEEGAGQLVAELDAVAGDGAAGVGEAEGGTPVDGGPEAGAETADEPGNHVGMCDAEGVVKMAFEKGRLGDQVHGQPGHDAGAQPQEDGAPAGDDTGGRGDGDEARDHAVDGPQDRRFLVVEDVAEGPGQEGDGGAQVGVEDGDAGVGGGGIRITTVETVPADPEDSRADEHDEDVVGPRVLAVLGEARPDPVGADEARGAGGEVDDVAARVVDGAEVEEEPAAPEGVGPHGVAEGEPEGHEEGPGVKVHTAQEGAGDEDEGDGGEDELEVDHGGQREILPDADGREVGRLEHGVDADDGVGLAHKGQHVFAKGGLVAPEDPADEDGGEGVKGHKGAVDGPFLLDEAGVQDDQARDGLEGDEGGGGELPRIVTYSEEKRKKKKQEFVSYLFRHLTCTEKKEK